MIKTCKVKDRCGACKSVGRPYEETLLEKTEMVKQLYPKYLVEDCVGMKDPYNYRNKVYATFASDKKGMVYAGMYQQYSHKVVSSKNCKIQNTIANRIVETMCKLASEMKLEAYNEDRGWGVLRHAYIRVSQKTGKVLLTIVIAKNDLPGSKRFLSGILAAHPEIETIILNWNKENTSMILGDKERVMYGKGYITDEIDGLTFRIGSRSFYQVNPVQTEILYKTAIKLADLNKNDEVFDACCGIGTISLLTARKVHDVVGVEINEDAIRDAKMNAKLNNIQNVQFFAEDATSFIDRLLDVPSVVFLDPPRSGMSREFMDSLSKMGPKKVVYISCNPETQARDIKNLTCGGYAVEKIVPVDMFPFTEHVETIVLLVKNGTPNLNKDYKPVKSYNKKNYNPRSKENYKGQYKSSKKFNPKSKQKFNNRKDKNVDGSKKSFDHKDKKSSNGKKSYVGKGKNTSGTHKPFDRKKNEKKNSNSFKKRVKK